MMTGGVSKNKGLVKTMEEKLGTTLVISDKAQFFLSDAPLSCHRSPFI